MAPCPCAAAGKSSPRSVWEEKQGAGRQKERDRKRARGDKRDRKRDKRKKDRMGTKRETQALPFPGLCPGERGGPQGGEPPADPELLAVGKDKKFPPGLQRASLEARAAAKGKGAKRPFSRPESRTRAQKRREKGPAVVHYRRKGSAAQEKKAFSAAGKCLSFLVNLPAGPQSAGPNGKPAAEGAKPAEKRRADLRSEGLNPFRPPPPAGRRPPTGCRPAWSRPPRCSSCPGPPSARCRSRHRP